jgi:hypothetical protein
MSKSAIQSALLLPRLSGILTAILAAGFLASLVAWLERGLRRLQERLIYPFPNDGLEGTLLHEARLVWAGEPLYRPLTRYEFVSAPYPPIHTAAVALFDQVSGPSPFWGGRLVSALAACLIALLIILIIQLVSRSWLAAIAGGVGAIIFFTSPAVLLWASRIKPDMLAIAMAILGLLLALRGAEARPTTGRWPADRNFGWLIGAAICFTLAFFTRQTTVMAAFAVSVALVLDDLIDYRAARVAGVPERRPWPLRARTFAFGSLLLILAFGTWGMADLITAGQFTAHVWGLHNSEWWSLYLVQKYILRLIPYWPSVLLAIPVLIWGWRDPRVRMLACYMLIAPITIIGAAEISANHNHLLESHVAIGLTSGAALAWALWVAPTKPIWLPIRVATLAILVLQIQLATQPQKVFEGEFKPGDPPARFVEFIRNTPGEILADDVGLLIAAGKPIRYNDPSTMGPAARWGIWDQSGLLEEIAQKRFSAIMLRDDVEKDPYDDVGRWTREMRAAIREHYTLKFRDKIRVYVPK